MSHSLRDRSSRRRALPSRVARRVRTLAGLGIASLLAACGDSPTEVLPGTQVAEVVVTATRQMLAPGDTLRVTAQVMDSLGRVLPTEPVTWSSTTPGVARIDGDGLVTADSVGSTTIMATAGGVTGAVDLTIEVQVLCDCTRVIDSTAVALVSRNDTTGLYVFEVLRGPPPALEPGAIIVGAQGQGYIRRVETSVLVGSTLTVETATAYVEEAVRDGGFATTAFTDGPTGVAEPGGVGAWLGPWRTVHMAEGVGLKDDGTCCSLNGLEIAIGLGGQLGDVDGSDVRGNLKFTISDGSITFAPRAEVRADIGFFQLTRFRTVFRGDLGLDVNRYELDVGISGSVTKTPLKKESKNFIIQQRPYATFIGPMPVVMIFTKKIALEITPTVSASAVFEGTFRTGMSLQTGVDWRSSSGWRPVSSATPRLDATAPEFVGVRGSASVKIAVVPELNVLIYGAVGPFVNLEPYAEASASSELSFASGTPIGLDWATNVAIGLNLNMGAKLSLMGRKDLLAVGFAIPLVQPRELVRSFSDGPLTVRTVTTGEDIPDSLGLRLRPAFRDVLPLIGVRDLSDSNRDVMVGPTDTVRLGDIRSGPDFPHEVGLSQVAGNCFVDSKTPDTVAINSGAFIALGNDTTSAAFSVDCIPFGDLRVSTTVTGPDPAASYSLTLHRDDTVGVGRADEPETIVIGGGAAPADTVLEDFIPVNPRRGGTGKLDATLEPSRRNCAVARPSTNPNTIQSGDTVTTRYLVTCVPLGRLRISTVTADADSGPASDPIVYTPTLAAQSGADSVPTPPDPIGADDSTLVGDLVPLYGASGADGRYVLGLGDIPNRCTVTSGLQRTVTVFPGDTAVAGFSLECVERLHVITRTTGPGLDIGGYGVEVDMGDGTRDTVWVAMNDTTGIPGVAPGVRSIGLVDVDARCTAPSEVEHAVDGRDSTLVVLQVDCPEPPDTTPPTAPGSVAAAPINANSVSLVWLPAADPESGIASYIVRRDGAEVGRATGLTFTDFGLAPETSYSYAVSAVNGDGLEGPAREASTTTPAVGNGDLLVRTSTSGVDFPNELTVNVTSASGELSRSVAPIGSTLFADLTSTTYAVSLLDVPSNCAVDGDNPRTVAVIQGSTVETVFSVVCGPP